MYIPVIEGIRKTLADINWVYIPVIGVAGIIAKQNLVLNPISEPYNNTGLFRTAKAFFQFTGDIIV